jgi:phosphoribosyl-ATP pyrophosphohydrolase
MTDLLEDLYQRIETRKASNSAHSYSAQLLEKGIPAIAQKCGEEAVETIIAATSKDQAATIEESADLLYHLMVLWTALDITPDMVNQCLQARSHRSGIDEKNRRKGTS